MILWIPEWGRTRPNICIQRIIPTRQGEKVTNGAQFTLEKHEHFSSFLQFVSNSPVFLKYPNYLADSSYDAYSGFEWYYAAEIYGQFSDGCEARRGGKDVGNIDAWSRIRQGSKLELK